MVPATPLFVVFSTVIQKTIGCRYQIGYQVAQGVFSCDFRDLFNSEIRFIRQEMQHKAKSIRPFIGARNFEISRQFYRDLGFEESVVSNDMSLFSTNGVGFYLQNACVKDWIDNTMLFLEVSDVERHWSETKALELPSRYDNVRLSTIRTEHWGKEYFLHDPSGILWHFGEFRQ